MLYEPTDTAAMARTSNLNEELGQVDKRITGSNSALKLFMWGSIFRKIYSCFSICLFLFFVLSDIFNTLHYEWIKTSITWTISVSMCRITEDWSVSIVTESKEFWALQVSIAQNLVSVYTLIIMCVLSM